MNYENLYVNPAEARAAKQQIESAIADLDNSKAILDSKIRMFYDSNEARWIESFMSGMWKDFDERYYPKLIADLKGQANNLEVAAQAAERLDQ